MVGSVRAVRLQVATPYLRPRTKTNMATLEIDYQPDLNSDHCIAYITLEPKSIDKDATLQVIGEINAEAEQRWDEQVTALPAFFVGMGLGQARLTFLSVV